MKACRICGEILDDSALFCPNCGNSTIPAAEDISHFSAAAFILGALLMLAGIAGSVAVLLMMFAALFKRGTPELAVTLLMPLALTITLFMNGLKKITAAFKKH